MNRRTLSALAVALGSLTGLAVALVLLLHHVPGFYLRSAVEPGPERIKRSDELNKIFALLFEKFESGFNSSNVQDVEESKFSYPITQDQLNSFLAEDFVKLGLTNDLAKLGIYDPRVTFDKNRLRLAFCYGKGFWSTILSYDVKIWLAPRDPNTLLIELQGRKAGALPIPSQQILQEISEFARKHSVQIQWFRNRTNPVALVTFLQDSGQRNNAQIRHLAFDPGKITIGGQLNDPNKAVDSLQPDAK